LLGTKGYVVVVVIVESISLWIASFNYSTSGDAYASAMVVGVSSMRYIVKSSPKDFATLCLLLLLGATPLSSYSFPCGFIIGSIVGVGLGINSFDELGKE
jgi:hypothetical protein